MNRIKNSLVAFGGLSLLIGAIALVTPRPTQGQGGDTVGPTKPVKVVNTPAEPVPVTGSITGSVNVVNTPAVNAQQSGEWNVGIVGTPTVGLSPSANTVKIDPSSALPVNNSANQPFQSLRVFQIANGEREGFSSFSGPNGKQLVIEYVSAIQTVPTDDVTFYRIQTTAGGNSVTHYMPPVTVGGERMLGQQVKLYADPGTEVSVSAFRRSVGGLVTVNLIISGHLVDVP